MKTKTVYGMWVAGLIILSGCQLTEPPSPAMQESARPAPIVQETAKPVPLAPSSGSAALERRFTDGLSLRGGAAGPLWSENISSFQRFPTNHERICSCLKKTHG